MKAIIKLKDNRQIKIDLMPESAPLSVENFVQLAKSGFYKGLIFHRVIENFMIQGGGFNVDMQPQGQAKAIKGEFLTNGIDNKLKHTKGTISMARTSDKDSASSQFFICVANTPHLDCQYAAFGRCSDEESIQVAVDISKVDTASHGYYSDVPKEPIIIEDIEIIE